MHFRPWADIRHVRFSVSDYSVWLLLESDLGRPTDQHARYVSTVSNSNQLQMCFVMHVRHPSHCVVGYTLSIIRQCCENCVAYWVKITGDDARRPAHSIQTIFVLTLLSVTVFENHKNTKMFKLSEVKSRLNLVISSKWHCGNVQSRDTREEWYCNVSKTILLIKCYIKRFWLILQWIGNYNTPRSLKEGVRTVYLVSKYCGTLSSKAILLIVLMRPTCCAIDASIVESIYLFLFSAGGKFILTCFFFRMSFW